MTKTAGFAMAALLLCASPAVAGPPYVTDDPEPTDVGHYEIYLFAGGMAAHGDSGGEGGIDFNYGAAPDLQLTAVVPLSWNVPSKGPAATAVGNVEVAAKYRFLHQADAGFDVAFFPAVSLPAGSGKVGERHVSLELPVWMERDWGAWSTFGGGGCDLDLGAGKGNGCLLGWALTRQVISRLQVGAEIYHQTAFGGARASTGLGFGAIYDLDENFHVLASSGPGIQNADATDRYSWYAALLLTF